MNSDHPRTEDEPVAGSGPPGEDGGESPESSDLTPSEETSADIAPAAEEEAAGPDEPPAPPPDVDKPRGRGGFFSFLALVMALAALLATAWMWWQDQGSATDLEERIFSEIARLESGDSELDLKIRQVRDEVEGIPTADQGARVDALERRLETDLAEMERLERAVEEQLAVSRSLQLAGESLQRRLEAAESAVAGMATASLDAGGELDLAEVDYLLRLANERLKLFHDPVAADETLELADMHLAALDDPVFLAVRQDIAAARRDLAALDLPDYFAIGNELDAVQAAIARLPFKGSEAAGESSPEAKPEGWWEKLKSVFSGMVTVRRSTELEEQRISLEDQDYVRQRLWLQLEISHLALMRRDQEAFGNSLQRVEQTLEEWFDQTSAAYRSVEDRLEALATMPVGAEMPDISQPWATLKQVRSLRSAPRPVDSAAVPGSDADPAPEGGEPTG